MLGQMENLTVT